MKTWFNERIGADTLDKVLLKRKIPKTSWFHTLGSICLALIAIQALTGIFLAMNYSPSPDHAYDSVLYSMGLPSGKFLRGMHSWGASFLVTFAFLHIMRVFFWGSYKFPRDATWKTGVVLLLLIFAFGFTGYLLPWSQRSYWATVVGVRMAEQGGNFLGNLLRGGSSIGVVTLTRFYAIHTMLLPAIAVGVVIFHLYLVVYHGISNKPERVKKDGNNEN